MLHLAHHVDAPLLRGLRLIADALEGNANFDLIARVRDLPLRLIYEIRGEVDGIPGPGLRLAQRPIRLHAQGIDAEGKRLAVIVEGVEQDLDPIVVPDAVPVRERGVDGAVALEGADAEVDRVGRVPHEDLGRIGGGTSVHGGVFGESVQHCGLAPDGLAEHAVDRHVGIFEPRDGDGRPSVAARVRTGLEQGHQHEREGEHSARHVQTATIAPMATSPTSWWPDSMATRFSGRPSYA